MVIYLQENIFNEIEKYRIVLKLTILIFCEEHYVIFRSTGFALN